MTSSIVSFVEAHGLLAVFLFMTLESCGIPIPSELVMPVAGGLAAGALGGASIDPVAATVAGALGNLVGSLIAYVLAARFGEPLLLGPGRYVGLSRRHIELADRLFAGRGLWIVFAGRLLPVVRTYISFPAGMARVEIARFSVLTFLGALPWCAALVAAGYAVGANYDRVNGPITKVALVVAAMLVVAIAVWFVRGRERPGDPSVQ